MAMAHPASRSYGRPFDGLPFRLPVAGHSRRAGAGAGGGGSGG